MVSAYGRIGGRCELIGMACTSTRNVPALPTSDPLQRKGRDSQKEAKGRILTEVNKGSKVMEFFFAEAVGDNCVRNQAGWVTVS
jgi:hypothetical protein